MALDTLLDTGGCYPVSMEAVSLIAALAAAPTHAPLADGVVLDDHGQGATIRGRTAVAATFQAYFGSGFPDGRPEIEICLADGESIAVALTFCGRHDGPVLGLPATGREVAIPMVFFFKHTADRIYRIAWYYDAGTILRQIGLLP